MATLGTVVKLTSSGTLEKSDATFMDLVTTVVDPNKALLGFGGYAQAALLVIAGMSINSKRYKNSLNPFYGKDTPATP